MIPNFKLGNSEIEQLFTEQKITDFTDVIERLKEDKELVSSIGEKIFVHPTWIHPVFSITAICCYIMELNGLSPEIIYCLYLKENFFSSSPGFIPSCMCYLRLEGTRLAIGLKQEYVEEHTSKIVREQRIDCKQLADWSYTLFSTYCLAWLERNPDSHLRLEDLMHISYTRK